MRMRATMARELAVPGSSPSSSRPPKLPDTVGGVVYCSSMVQLQRPATTTATAAQRSSTRCPGERHWLPGAVRAEPELPPVGLHVPLAGHRDGAGLMSDRETVSDPSIGHVSGPTGPGISPRDASCGRDLCPGGNDRPAEEMAAEVDAEAEPGWSRVGLHLKLSDLLDADGLYHDDVAVTRVAGRRRAADEASQARVVGDMDRSGRQVSAGAVPRSGRESGHR